MATLQDALKHLASIDLIDLCKEAKAEHCRATRDLRSCGRPVEWVLNSCGHSSLCAECSQRCDICPICRVPLAKSGKRLRLRLYYECVEAGLISSRCDDGLDEHKNDESHLAADMQRLYSLFDVALDNNLCCLICQYVTDVCMDESAVSSDPVIAFLLDEVVVKDWCKRTFKNIIDELQGIYNLEVDEMKMKMNSLIKFSTKLNGISNVLEVLESSFKGARTARLDDLQHLQESIFKTKQHMEMMLWCIRHEFLENVRSRYLEFRTWSAVLLERKLDAISRAWPEPAALSLELSEGNSTLFIEDALLNLETEHGDEQQRFLEFEIASLQKDRGSSLFRSKIEGLAVPYPFENLRAAVDILFLYGSSEMVMAKQATVSFSYLNFTLEFLAYTPLSIFFSEIYFPLSKNHSGYSPNSIQFLYYLFDRHWTLPDDKWRYIVDDFAATFGTTRQALLESFTFYLLDDHSEEALQEARRMLPEISGPESHPKIAKVLLERQDPDAALMFLRWSGLDGGSVFPSLSEAVTAVCVRVECGLLTESFMYQRMICTKVKEKALRPQLSVDSDNSNVEIKTWMEWMDVLVTELCCLCIRRNLVDRMIELPWNSDEEKYLQKCLLDYTVTAPSTIIGNLLVVFYLQRYRYIEAYNIDQKLQTLEQEFESKCKSGELLHSMRSARHWRSELVKKCVALLPESQQQQLKAGRSLEGIILSGHEFNTAREAVPEMPKQPAIIPPMPNSSLILQMDRVDSSIRPSGSGNSRQDEYMINSPSELGNLASPFVPSGDFFTAAGKGLKSQFEVRKNLKFGNTLTPGLHKMKSMEVSVAKGSNRISSRVLQDEFQDAQLDGFFPDGSPGDFYPHLPKVSPPYSHRVMARPTRTPSSNRDSPEERFTSASGKRRSAGDPNRLWSMFSQNDVMDISPSNENNGSSENPNINAGPRWRSDDTSEEEGDPKVNRNRGSGSNRISIRRSRRSGLSRR